MGQIVSACGVKWGHITTTNVSRFFNLGTCGKYQVSVDRGYGGINVKIDFGCLYSTGLF